MTTPGGALLRFHGFEEPQLRALRAARAGLSIVTQRPERAEVADGTIAPLKYRGTKNSGVYDASQRLVELSARVRGETHVEGALRPDQLRNAATDRRHAYYLGSGEKHYGHFLLEVLCRAWAWEECGKDRVGIVQSALPPFAKSLYALIPGLPERAEVVARPTRFASVTVPAASFVIARQAHTEFKRLCERMAERAMGSLPPKTAQPLYLSRAALDSSRRGLEGELWLEQVLQREGFAVVRPETLPMSEQIALFNRHEWIVSTTGSASHTRVFSLSANNFVIIAPAFFNQNHVLCDLLCAGTAHYVNALVRPDIGVNINLANVEPLLLDAQAVLITLKELGLVRPSVAVDAPAPDLHAYKVRWLAAARWRLKANPPDAAVLRAAIDTVAASLGAAAPGKAGTRSTRIGRSLPQLIRRFLPR